MNDSNITITEASSKDLNKLVEMVLKLWPDCDYEEEFERNMQMLDATNEQVFLIKVRQESVGFIQLSLRTDYVEGTTTSPVVYIEGIYVEPAHRKLGLAQLLVQHAEKWGLEKECSEIASDVEIDNITSINFHNAIGFKEANRVVCFAKKIQS